MLNWFTANVDVGMLTLSPATVGTYVGMLFLSGWRLPLMPTLPGPSCLTSRILHVYPNTPYMHALDEAELGRVYMPR